MTRWFRSAVVVVALLLCVSGSARAQSDEINLVTANLIRGSIDELIKNFEAETNHTVKAAYSPGGVAVQKVVKGTPFDLAILKRAFHGPGRLGQRR